MYQKSLRTSFGLFLAATVVLTLTQCAGSRKTGSEIPEEVIYTNQEGQGVALSLSFLKGKEHNHPLMAVWVEDLEGNYVETLYVAESIGKGIFQRADNSAGKWEPGPARRPAALPYWSHKRGIRAPDGYYVPDTENPVPDAITGPTPQGNFTLASRVSEKNTKKFNVLFEINQPWDWNAYWTNNKYPGNEQYMTSSQPAVVYRAEVDLGSDRDTYELEPIGHSHYAGENGQLYSDLTTLSTAMEIADRITLRVIK